MFTLKNLFKQEKTTEINQWFGKVIVAYRCHYVRRTQFLE
jgi:hypothetical protein